MISFTTKRERRLWAWTAIVVVGICTTVFVSGSVLDIVERRTLDSIFVFFFLGLVGAIVLSGLTKRPGRFEIWIFLGVVAVYTLLFVRLGLPERTHLFEYGLVGVLTYQALLERQRNGPRVPAPAFLAVAVTALLGWLDEGIQALLPNRVYDIRDVGFNALAALMAVGATLALAWARRRRQTSTEKIDNT